MHFIDFELVAQATYPHSVSNVVNIDGYIGKFFLLEWIGAICTRKFTTDIQLVKSIAKVLKRGDVLAMYPEARYSPAGTLAFLPDSLGKLGKMNKVPVVAVVHRGNHLYAPFWNFRDKRKVPFHTTFTKILTPEQINEMSVDEINAKLTHDIEKGFTLEGEYRSERYYINRLPIQTNSLHVEYDFGPLGKFDYIDISTENDSFLLPYTR